MLLDSLVPRRRDSDFARSNFRVGPQRVSVQFLDSSLLADCLQYWVPENEFFKHVSSMVIGRPSFFVVSCVLEQPRDTHALCAKSIKGKALQNQNS